MSQRNVADKLASQFLTRDPFELARSLNRTVVERELADVRGLCLLAKKQYFLFIDPRLEGFERDFVCAHELGHSILHGGINTGFLESKTRFVRAKYETEADHFALDLILPDDRFAEYINMPLPDIAAALGLSGELVEYRMHQAQMHIDFRS